jgi:hypothetical protein
MYGRFVLVKNPGFGRGFLFPYPSVCLPGPSLAPTRRKESAMFIARSFTLPKLRWVSGRAKVKITGANYVDNNIVRMT